MTLAQRCVLALWGAVLIGILCLVFLPLPGLSAMLLMLVLSGLAGVIGWANRRRGAPEESIPAEALPAVGYRQPVVLVCGDLEPIWPEETAVMMVTQGCWIRVAAHQDVAQVARQLLQLRPEWQHQLAVMVAVCPQLHSDAGSLTRQLLIRREQLGQLRRMTGHAVPLLLQGLAGSAMLHDWLWQVALPGKGISVCAPSTALLPLSSWHQAEETRAMQPQIIMNSLIAWFQQHVIAVFADEEPDMPAIQPGALLWGIGPALAAAQPVSLWQSWLQQQTAIREVAGWHPAENETAPGPSLPGFVLPLLPVGTGLTSRQRAWRYGLTMFTLATALMLCSSAWNNRQLLQRLAFDIRHYEHIAMEEHQPKAEAVGVLREEMAQLDSWTRQGVPARMSLGLYQGERLRMPLLEAIRSYVPPPAPPPQVSEQEPVMAMVRLDSLSLFDSGQHVLKANSTRMMINSLVGIKAKPGWLIVVSGHTDNTGDPLRNQALSLRRAEAVRDWMRDTGDVPESCFAVQGYGESRPIATNDTLEGRALNRRVEISLVPQADACQIPDKTQMPALDDGLVDNRKE